MSAITIPMNNGSNVSGNSNRGRPDSTQPNLLVRMRYPVPQERRSNWCGFVVVAMLIIILGLTVFFSIRKIMRGEEYQSATATLIKFDYENNIPHLDI